MRPAHRGIGALRWTRSAFSSSTRNGPSEVVQLAIGATGAPRRPSSVGRAMSLSRSGTPRRCASSAFAWELISAIFTPCGQTWVQMPQLEQ